ncbi:MAG: hypothetical protein ACYDD1_15670, partial [Caulobacteraceae bacterium]
MTATIFVLLVLSSGLLAVFVCGLIRPPLLTLSRNGIKYCNSLGSHRSWSWAEVENPELTWGAGGAKIALNGRGNSKSNASLVVASYPIRPEDLLALIKQKALEASSIDKTTNTIVTPTKLAKRSSLGWVSDNIKPVILVCCLLFLAYL